MRLNHKTIFNNGFFFKSSTQQEHLFGCSKYSEMQVYSCTFFYDRILSVCGMQSFLGYINDTTNILPQDVWSFPFRFLNLFWSTQLKSSNGTWEISQLGSDLLWKTSVKLIQLKKLLSLEGTTSQEVEYNDACAFWCSMHSLSWINILVVFVSVSLRL